MKLVFISLDLLLVDSYWINYQKGGKEAVLNQTQIDAIVSQIQQDILANGPLTATMTVYSDFQDWDATQSFYTGPKAGAENMGGHAVVITGWNRTSAGVPYWLIRNSWSKSESCDLYYGRRHFYCSFNYYLFLES